ncbi:ArnT family glycosyltransferase [Streptomyces sp. NPDC048496]|uniref:ArnT family glycosyltransferase n=1 Tax=Streptomyces sp. NPDC048496 TaxID=3365558 RepID=UPI0037144A6F
MTSPYDSHNAQNAQDPHDPRNEEEAFTWFNTNDQPPTMSTPVVPEEYYPGQRGEKPAVPDQRGQDPHGQDRRAGWHYAQPRYDQGRYGSDQGAHQQISGALVPAQRDQETHALRTVAEPVAAGPATAEPAAAEAAYHIPETPEAGWDMGASSRRSWVSRCILLCVLAIQAVLSLRLSNTAFQDEALYLSAGHAELAHLLHGVPLPVDYGSYFSGAPQLYPVAAALADDRFGLTGARVLSLVCMLGTTGLLYSFARRLFNERAALAAAALFGVTQSTIVLGYFATYDAPAVLLLAFAAWLVVRLDRAPIVAVLLAAPPAVLAVGVKYASALYLPSLVGIALLVAWPHRGKAAFGRAVLLALGMGALLGCGLYFTDVLDGVRATTTAREHGTDSAAELLRSSALWSGLVVATAVGGAISYVRRGRMFESPLSHNLAGPGWRWRLLVGLLLCGTALLAPAYQIHLSTSVALYKHLGFGLLFAAPMAGVGVTRLMGAHFRYPQLGIMLWVATLCLGISQSQERFSSWAPQPDAYTQLLRNLVKPDKGRYLASTPNVPVYYLSDITDQSHWTSLYGIGYKDVKGVTHRGNDGYRTAIKDGWFDLVVLDGVATPEEDKVVAAALKASGRYRLMGTVPFTAGGMPGEYRVWSKTG